MIEQSVITCPTCHVAKLETMPIDTCQFFYECTGCGTLLRPKPGDCCVFCSTGQFPARQSNRLVARECAVNSRRGRPVARPTQS